MFFSPQPRPFRGLEAVFIHSYRRNERNHRLWLIFPSHRHPDTDLTQLSQDTYLPSILTQKTHISDLPDLARMCCWDRDRSRKKLITSWFVCLKKCNLVFECLEDTCLVKNGSNMYLDDDWAKEVVIICDYVNFSCKNERTQDCFWSPKGAGLWRNLWDTDTGNKRSVRRLAFY